MPRLSVLRTKRGAALGVGAEWECGAPGAYHEPHCPAEEENQW
jgi:hypothetical protein